jgi:hypothetical protein
MDEDDKPTTMNGLLHDPSTTLDDRRIVAIFETAQAAKAAREQLLLAGIPEDRVKLLEQARQDVNAAASAQPPDRSIVGAVRSAVLPDDDTLTYSEAVKEGDAMLTVHPLPNETDEIVRLLEAAHPKHFDARLERWRNSG